MNTYSIKKINQIPNPKNHIPNSQISQIKNIRAHPKTKIELQESSKDHAQQQQYFQCEQSQIIQHQLLQILERPTKNPNPLNTESKKSLRIEDQAIIFVQEENEILSQKGGESIILEHIQFKKDPNIYQLTPKWSQGYYQQKINFQQIIKQPWMHAGQDNLTDSFHDFSNLEFKIPQSRQSKKTCYDPIKKPEFDSIEKNNKSCIAKPMNSAEDCQEFRPQEDNEILDKSIICQNCEKRRLFYYEQSIQTDLTGRELLHNENYLNEQIQYLKSKLNNQQKQNNKFYHIKIQYQNKIKQLIQNLSIKNNIIQNLKKYQEKYQEYQSIIHTLKYKIQSYQQIKIQNNYLQRDQNIHQQCKKQIEILQEHIFDIQQKLARVEIEIQLKVQTIRQQLQSEISQKYNLKYSDIIKDLKQKIQHTQSYEFKSIEEKKKDLEIKNQQSKTDYLYQQSSKKQQMIEQSRSRNKSKPKINQRLSNYYHAKNIELRRQRTMQSLQKSIISNNSQYQIKQSRNENKAMKTNNINILNSILSPKNNRQSIQQKLRFNGRLLNQQNIKQKRNSNKNNSNQKQNLQLYVINSKIQKLRNQITKQLDSIH